MRRGFVLLILMLAFSCLAAAEPQGKTEITVYSGWSFLDAEKSVNLCPECMIPFDRLLTASLKGGAMVGFKGGYYINRRMEVEGSFSVIPGRRVDENIGPVCVPGVPCPAIDFPSFHIESTAITYEYEGNFVYNFPLSAVSPYVTFGIGGVSTSVSSATHHDFALNYGGGAKVYFGNVGLRLEVNDHLITNYFLNDKTEHDVQVQYGFAFRVH